MHDENLKYKYLDEQCLYKILQQFSDDEELYSFHLEYIKMYKQVPEIASDMTVEKSEQSLLILANIVGLIVNFYKENIEIIQAVMQVLDYKYLSKEDMEKLKQDFTKDKT